MLEVYPHVALLGLTGRGERLPYKVARVRTYWPHDSNASRKRRLVGEWTAILKQLGQHIDGIRVSLPNDPEGYSLRGLKRFEDAIDGLVCAWVAVEFLRGSATPLGDETAAIWIPSSAMQFSKEVDAA
jgi:predicted RNase H-like nuclease